MRARSRVSGETGLQAGRTPRVASFTEHRHGAPTRSTDTEHRHGAPTRSIDTEHRRRRSIGYMSGQKHVRPDARAVRRWSHMHEKKTRGARGWRVVAIVLTVLLAGLWPAGSVAQAQGPMDFGIFS